MTQKSSEKEIKDFLVHLDNSANEMLLDEEEYDSRFDVIINMNGKEVRVELGAETFHLVKEILEIEIA